MTYWFDGRLWDGSEIALPTNEPALLYGATVFTTLRVYGSRLDHPLTDWVAHWQRIVEAATAFGWPTPDRNRVRQGAEALLENCPILRITGFPDGRELVTGRNLPADLDQMQSQGITVWVARGERYQRPVPSYKTGNYLGAWLALQAAQQHGAREAILVDARGQWLETSTGNLWGWANGQWHTPGLGAGLLPGIVRARLLQHLKQRGEQVNQSPWPPGVIQRFEALAYSNSAVQVVPIHTVLGHTVLSDRSRLEINPQQPVLEALRAAFREN
ncbi:aminotransferase class IV [Nodosilinea sp. LEGE 06152]|uniref:aminotransferase class IV n=1 Tax=Nodosilinea sp. LEGE 06152 TaxID=2777966 RepID=UPI0018816273|nr:aminotransferase class IV [Nodosilinea sp. LEGE 06152]MBE9156098.1 aminotransferase class IV [Nodosilinea sp. LEGE 06152]